MPLKRIKHQAATFPIGTVGPQDIVVTLDADMESLLAVGFVEIQGSAQQYRLGIKRTSDSISIIDPLPKQLLLASTNVKNDERYEQLVGVEAKNKQITFQIIFDTTSIAAVTLNFALVQYRN